LIEEYDEQGGAFWLVRRYVYVGAELVRVESARGPGAPLVAFTPLVTLTGSVGGYLAGDGSVTELILYGAYGTPVFKVPNGAGGFVDSAGTAVAGTLLFQGQWYDEETGLYQLGERNLHPQLGCFLQRDSQLYTMSRALYAAFNGDPAGQVDPSGAGAESPGPIQKAKEIKKGLKDLHEKAEGMRVALKGTVFLEDYKQTATAKAGLDLVASALEFGGVVGGDNFKTFAKETTANFEHLQTGLDIVQEALDWRANRKVLALIEANTMPGLTRTATGRMRSLTEKGMLGDWDGSLRTALESEAVKATEDRKRGDGPAMYGVRKEAQSDYLLQRQGHLLSIGQKGHTLAKAWMDYAYKDSKAAEVQTARTLLEGSKLLLDGADLFHKVMENKDLAKMSFGIGQGAASAQLKSLWGAKGNVSAAFEFGFEVGQFGVMQLVDPDVAAAYKSCVQEFKDNGGWTSVFGGVLATAGWDWGAYQVQKYVDFSLEYELNKLASKLSYTDDRWEFYRRGLEAP
jgi:RHS repeat-associated protein